MREIEDVVFEDGAGGGLRRDEEPLARGADSPLRAWGMWSGLSAIGVVCAAGVARAVSLVGRTVTTPK